MAFPKSDEEYYKTKQEAIQRRKELKENGWKAHYFKLDQPEEDGSIYLLWVENVN